jgi:tricorn protease
MPVSIHGKDDDLVYTGCEFMRDHTRFSLTFLVLAACQITLSGASDPSTRLLRTPTVSGTQIAFTHASNLRIVGCEGGIARRLTSFQGQTTNPHFSPDGKWLAFSAEYAGNTDGCVMPAEGGEPKRLTWHPGNDTVQGWTPDGEAVLFTSSRATWAPTACRTVPAKGGVEEPLAFPRGYQGKIRLATEPAPPTWGKRKQPLPPPEPKGGSRTNLQ